MKSIFKITLIVFSIISVVGNRADASHMMGGEITWTCVGQDSFLIKLVAYRDCNGISIGTTTITFTCATTGTSITTINLGVGTPVDITPLCSSSCNRCKSASCSFPYGIHRYSMAGIVRLSSAASCCNIRIYWEQCCRSYSTTTLVTNSDNFYTEAMMNRCQNPCDNSPTFNNTPDVFFCVGQDATIDFSTTDEDTNSNGQLSDSITYELTPPLLAGIYYPVTYNGQFSYIKPLTFWGFPNDYLPFPRGFHLNQQSGLLQFRPMVSQVTLISVKVNEFRNGVKIAETTRHLQVAVVNCPGNLSPSVSTPDKIKSKAVCIGDTVRFNFQSDDNNTYDTVRISAFYNIPGSIWTDSNGLTKHSSATFTWIPTAKDARTQPYYIKVTVNDNTCPLPGKYTEEYEILVRKPVSGSYTITDSGCGNYLFNTYEQIGSGFPFIWSGSINTNSKSFIHHFDQPGIYPFKFTTKNKNFCGNTIYDTIVTGRYLWVKLPGDTNICNGSTINLTAQAFDTKGSIRYQWSTADTVPVITVRPSASTWYKVVVTDSSGCRAVDSVLIKVNPVVNASPDTIVCTGQNVDISASKGFSSYLWNTGDTSSSISKIITKPVWAKVLATDTYNCLSSDSVFVDMFPITPVYAGADTSVCAINGLYELKGSPASISKGYWTGTAVTQDVSKKWYFNPDSAKVFNWGNYSLTYHYTDSSGCSFADSTKIKVYKYKNLSAGNYNNSCVDADTIRLNGSPAGGFWLGKGTTGSTFDPGMAGAGTHLLTYNLNDYCVFSDTTYITVFPSPNVTLNTYNGITEFCPTQGFIALNYSPYGGSGGKWFGDVEANHTFSTARVEGNYSIIYSFTDYKGCIGADTLLLKVRLPKITIDTTTPREVCFGKNVKLKATYKFANSILWSKPASSNGTFIGSLNNDQITYVPGQNDYANGGFWIRIRTFHTVCNTARDSIYIRAGYIPKAGFSADVLSGNIPLQVLFTDLSSIQGGNIPKYSWDFGDGGISDVQNPIYTYLNKGTYHVKLSIVSDVGCKDSLIKQNYIATTTSINDENNAFDLTIFPNPADRYIDISLTDRSIIAQLYVFNDSGKLMLYQEEVNQNSFRININDLKSGLYLIRVLSENGSEYLAKFVKE